MHLLCRSRLCRHCQIANAYIVYILYHCIITSCILIVIKAELQQLYLLTVCIARHFYQSAKLSILKALSASTTVRLKKINTLI